MNESFFNFSYLYYLQAKQASDLEQIKLREEKGLVDVKVSELQNKLEDVKSEDESKIKLLQGLYIPSHTYESVNGSPLLFNQGLSFQTLTLKSSRS